MKNSATRPPFVHKKAGFTLVELLVVIVIIASLAAIGITSVFRFRRAADRANAVSNLRQIQTANTAYAADHDGRYVPPSSGDPADPAGPALWFENPDFVSQLKGDSATFVSGGAPNLTLPLSLMDPAVVRAKPAGYETLGASYGYTVPQIDDAPRQAQLADPARSAAFITSDTPFVTQDTGAIAYRHDKKAVVVYYDGGAREITPAQVTSFGDASSRFWKATD